MPNSSVTTALGATFDTEQVASKHRQAVVLTTCASGGCSHYHKVLASGNNADVVKASPGQIYYVLGINVSATAAPFWVKLYDKTTNPAPASETPKCVFPFGVDLPPFYPIAAGIEFTNGIAVAVVTGIGDNNNTGVAANDGLVEIGYK